MKRKKLCYIFMFVLLFASIIAGCASQETPYTFFRQGHENVAKIEICAYDHGNRIRTPISALTKDQESAFLEELATLSCKTYFPGDHIRSYGNYQICITYTDGEIELIGPYNIGYKPPNELECLTKYYPASEQELWDLISRYVNGDILLQLQ